MQKPQDTPPRVQLDRAAIVAALGNADDPSERRPASLTHLAERVGIALETLSRSINGHATVPWEKAVVIAHELRVPLESLVARCEHCHQPLAVAS